MMSFLTRSYAGNESGACRNSSASSDCPTPTIVATSADRLLLTHLYRQDYTDWRDAAHMRRHHRVSHGGRASMTDHRTNESAPAIERRTIDVVPDDERHGTPRN